MESIPPIELTAEEANLPMPPLPPKTKTFIKNHLTSAKGILKVLEN
jgi:hypothetical protein